MYGAICQATPQKARLSLRHSAHKYSLIWCSFGFVSGGLFLMVTVPEGRREYRILFGVLRHAIQAICSLLAWCHTAAISPVCPGYYRQQLAPLLWAHKTPHKQDRVEWACSLSGGRWLLWIAKGKLKHVGSGPKRRDAYIGSLLKHQRCTLKVCSGRIIVLHLGTFLRQNMHFKKTIPWRISSVGKSYSNLHQTPIQTLCPVHYV